MTTHARGDEPAARRCMSAVRREMADGMTQLLATAVESYCRLAALCPNPPSVSEQTIKEFGAHHAACRSALAHIDRLIRIQQWAAAPTARENDIADSAALLAQARKILRDYPSEDE